MAKKKKTAPHFVVYADPFGAQVGVFLSRRRLKRFLKAESVTNWRALMKDITGKASAIYLTDSDHRAWFLSVMPSAKTSSQTVYHEASHLAWYVLDHHGVPTDRSEHEAITYQQGYLAEQIISHLKKRGRYGK